jgi:hypothetical protein
VATDWAPVIQTGIGAAAALVGGAIGAWLQTKGQERIEQRRLERELVMERQQRRDRAAVLLAEASALLSTSKAHWLAVDVIVGRPRPIMDAYRADYERLQDRQRVVCEQLLAMAIGAPSPEVRRLAQELSAAVRDSVSATWWRLRLADRQADEAPFDPSTARAAEDAGPRQSAGLSRW